MWQKTFYIFICYPGYLVHNEETLDKYVYHNKILFLYQWCSHPYNRMRHQIKECNINEKMYRIISRANT
jgi:hypothetical protein